MEAQMPRKPTVPDEKHREEQRRYRARLQAERKPEVAQVDTAVAVGMSALLRRAAFESRASRSVASAVLRDAVQALVAMGYDPTAARQLLRRRLADRNPRFERLLSRMSNPHDVSSY
jgi:hypothetical protein